MKLTDADCAALEEALALCRASDPARVEQRFAAGESYFDVAVSCAIDCQRATMHLAPWQSPVAIADVPRPTPDAQGLELLRRLLDAGLSRYTADPVAALAAARVKLQEPVR